MRLIENLLELLYYNRLSQSPITVILLQSGVALSKSPNLTVYGPEFSAEDRPLD